ncbi:MAG: SRPBCC family protein, partial [Pseudomonadota bacterium]
DLVVHPQQNTEIDLVNQLSDFHDDMAWLESDKLSLVHCEEQVRKVNWKILVEGGLEAYHFKVAHKNTIGPFFCDNLSTYRASGNHIRSILTKNTISDLQSESEASWQVRDHAQVLYTLFPSSALLVQSDHIAWIRFEPQAVDETRLFISTLVPSDQIETESQRQHWQKNHHITVNTLNEDFDIGESIQAGLSSGANQQLTFGRFEGALATFNEAVDRALSAGSNA